MVFSILCGIGFNYEPIYWVLLLLNRRVPTTLQLIDWGY